MNLLINALLTIHMDKVIQTKLDNIERQLQELREKYIYSLDVDRKIIVRRARALKIQQDKLLHDN